MKTTDILGETPMTFIEWVGWLMEMENNHFIVNYCNARMRPKPFEGIKKITSMGSLTSRQFRYFHIAQLELVRKSQRSLSQPFTLDLIIKPPPPHNGWAPGGYTCHCRTCKEAFQGDKLAMICESCAYMGWEPLFLGEWMTDYDEVIYLDLKDPRRVMITGSVDDFIREGKSHKIPLRYNPKHSLH